MKRKFCFTQQQLTDRADALIAACERDIETLRSKGFKDDTLERLKSLTDSFKGFPPDDENLQEIAALNLHCKETKKKIVKQIRLIQWQLEDNGNLGSEESVMLKTLKVHNVSEATFLKEVRKVQGCSVKLCAMGISATVTSQLGQMIMEYKTASDNFHAVMLVRKEESERRISIANDLADTISSICKFGKLVFKGVDDDKYKDYVMYNEEKE